MEAMAYTVETTATVDEDHNLVLNLPDVPPGMVRIVATVEPEGSQKLTGAELADSEFFRDWADRDDLPNTNEEFIEWRRKLWERPRE